MRSFELLSAAVLGITLLSGCGSSDPAAADLQPADLRLDQLVEKYTLARGGRGPVQAVRTVVMKGRLTTRGPQPSDNAPIEVAIAPPQHYARRLELEPGVITIQAIDGELAWQVFPQVGILEPTVMPATEAHRFRRRIDLAGELVDWQTKGHQAELLGKGQTDGRAVYAIALRYADGELTTLYLDALTFLPFREYERTLTARGWLEAEITYADYREVGGVRWPFSVVTRLPIANVVQNLIWEDIAINVELAATTFAMP